MVWKKMLEYPELGGILLTWDQAREQQVRLEGWISRSLNQFLQNCWGLCWKRGLSLQVFCRISTQWINPSKSKEKFQPPKRNTFTNLQTISLHRNICNWKDFQSSLTSICRDVLRRQKAKQPDKRKLKEKRGFKQQAPPKRFWSLPLESLAKHFFNHINDEDYIYVVFVLEDEKKLLLSYY